VRNEKVLRSVKEEKDILHAIKRRKVNWIGHILHRNCFVKHLTKGKLEGKSRRGRKLKQMRDDFEEKRKEKALDRTIRRPFKKLWIYCKTDHATNALQFHKQLFLAST
jgi:hypothetical protein